MKKTVIFWTLSMVLYIIQPAYSHGEPFNSTSVPENSIAASPQAWPWVVAGVVYIVVRLSEGQAHIIYHSDGKIERRCEGFGACASALIGGNGVNTWIESPYESFGYDFEINGMAIIRTNDGRIILTHREGQLDQNLNKLFYSGEINITPQLTFNNPEHLQALGVSQPFTIGGTYQVQEKQGFTYIFLN